MREKLRGLARTHPRYGYRKIHVILRREGWRLGVAILPRSAGLDVGRAAVVEAAPVLERSGDEFGAVVTADEAGSVPAQRGDVLERTDVWSAPIRLATGVASASRVCSSVIVRILDWAAVVGLVVEEVDRPHMIRVGGRDMTRAGRPGAHRRRLGARQRRRGSA